MRIRWLPLFVLVWCLARSNVAHGQNLPPPKSNVPIEDRVRILQAQMIDVKNRVSACDKQLPKINQTVKELLEKVYSVERPQIPMEEKKPEPEEKPKPKKVEYRPPLFVLKKRSVIFVCRESRLYVLDMRSFESGLKAAVAGATNVAQALSVGRSLPSGDGDFDVQIERSLPRLRFEAILKPNRSGESQEQIQKTDSAFMGWLAKLNPKVDAIGFIVFPDSFELLRSARSLIWARQFELEWFPKDAGAKLLFQ